MIKISLLLIMLPFYQFGQTEFKKSTPKNNWYFGIEMGPNYTDSFQLGEPDKSFQIGLVSEYYFSRKISLMGRVKYFETGLSYNSPTNDWSGYKRFDAQYICVPLNLKYEFPIDFFNNSFLENMRLHFKGGITFNKEIKTNYIYLDETYTKYVNTSKTFYPGLNLGIGMGYFIYKNLAVYVDYELYKYAEEKGEPIRGFLLTTKRSPFNHMMNFGVKYSFKKNKVKYNK